MWLCRHSSACSPGDVGGKVHASVHLITESGSGIWILDKVLR